MDRNHNLGPMRYRSATVNLELGMPFYGNETYSKWTGYKEMAEFLAMSQDSDMYAEGRRSTSYVQELSLEDIDAGVVPPSRRDEIVEADKTRMKESRKPNL